MKENDWVQFDALELVKKSDWPRVVTRRFFEINALGQVRYLVTKGKPRYVDLKPVMVSGKPYFMAPLGFTHGHSVVLRKPLRDIVKKYIIE